MNTRSSGANVLQRDRVLVIAPHGSYRTSAFIQAADSLKIDVLIASQGENSIVSEYVQGIHIDHKYNEDALNIILEEANHRPFNAVVATDDISTELVARVASELDLAHNKPAAVKLTQRKDLARLCLKQAGIPVPNFDLLDTRLALSIQERTVCFPAVIKPLVLSASRGVIRVNSETELKAAFKRVAKMMAAEHHLDLHDRHTLLLEAYVPGNEVAVEGMLYEGVLDVLAVFDKPDPLEGPFFEETYYLTPSQYSKEIQQQLKQTVQNACLAYGLAEGPIHAECRINENGIWIIEVAARTIGGLCGRLLKMGTGYSLEELVLQHALGKHIKIKSFANAAGVLMIPIPGAGILKRVEGLLEAQRIPFIKDVNIQIREGYELIPLPEGNSYLGFIFSQAATIKEAEQALRDAHACLKFVLAPLWKIAGEIKGHTTIRCKYGLINMKQIKVAANHYQLQETRLQEKLGGDGAESIVRCHLCLWRCRLKHGQRGFCQAHVNRNGTLYNLSYGIISAIDVGAIEDKPVKHFQPGTKVMSVGSYGCSFRCDGCHNLDISWGVSALDDLAKGESTSAFASPQDLIDSAKRSGVQGIAFTYSEPAVWLEYVLDVSKLARAQGLYTVYVSNSFVTDEALGIDGVTC